MCARLIFGVAQYVHEFNPVCCLVSAMFSFGHLLYQGVQAVSVPDVFVFAMFDALHEIFVAAHCIAASVDGHEQAFVQLVVALVPGSGKVAL